MIGWYHWLDGHVFEQALGVGDGQGGLACCNSWGQKTQLSNWTEEGVNLASLPIIPYRSSQSYGFSRNHVWRWELDHKESWALKNWCFWTVVVEKTLDSSLDGKEIKTVSPKGNQFWIFIGRTDAEAPVFWPSDAKNWLIGKDPYGRKDWRQEKKGTTEDKIVGWHNQLDWWTWIWASHRNWWWTGNPDVLQSMGSQRVGHNWVIEFNWMWHLQKHKNSMDRIQGSSFHLCFHLSFIHPWIWMEKLFSLGWTGIDLFLLIMTK